MIRIAYTIETAAQAVSVPDHVISVAIREGHLKACTANGSALILHTELSRWAATLPEWA